MVALGLELQKNQCHLLGFFFKIKKQEFNFSLWKYLKLMILWGQIKLRMLFCRWPDGQFKTCMQLLTIKIATPMLCLCHGVLVHGLLDNLIFAFRVNPSVERKKKNADEIVLPLAWELSSVSFHRRVAGWAAWLGVMASVALLSQLFRVLTGECSAMLWCSSMAKGKSLACTTLYCENPRGSVCSCCSLLVETLTCCSFLVCITRTLKLSPVQLSC